MELLSELRGINDGGGAWIKLIDAGKLWSVVVSQMMQFIAWRKAPYVAVAPHAGCGD